MEKLKSQKSYDGFTEIWQHSSKVTKTPMKFGIIRPSRKTPIKRGLIWLSGLTCTEENFISKAGAQRFVDKYKMAIICPDTSPRGLNLPGEDESYDFGTGAGFYVNATKAPYKDNYQMFSYINEEIYDIFNEMFDLKGNIGIFGHSMGGHGALISALTFPKKYKSVSAFAPIVNPVNSEWGKKAFTGYLGEDLESWAAYDTCQLLESGKRHPQTIYVEQGNDDEFLKDQLMVGSFPKVAKRFHQKSKVKMRDGYDHSYYFVSTFLKAHLNHHSKFL